MLPETPLGPTKRERTQSLEVKKNKKVKTADAQLSEVKQKSQRDHVRSWLTEASDKELDKLEEYIKKRRKKRTTTASRTESQTLTMVMDETNRSPEIRRRERRSNTDNKETIATVKVQRNISPQDIAQ